MAKRPTSTPAYPFDMEKFFESMKAGSFDFTKAFENFKVPGFDSNLLVESQRKNIEAVVAAQRICLEGMQAVAQRQAEIGARMVEESLAAMRNISATGEPKDQLVKQAELMKDGFAQCIASLRELNAMSNKSNTEAYEIISKRVEEGLEEMKASLESLSKAA